MTILDFIIWSPSPDIFVIPGLNHPVRWYGLLFAFGFIMGQQVMVYIFKKEGKNIKDVDALTMYIVAATILGARLGHCLFYNPGHYLSNPFEILKIWEGGLASHGGAIGLFIALYLYAKKYNFQYLWILDRVAIITVLAGACIRMGNFMNSEIIGVPTGTDKGIVFSRSFEEMFKSIDPRIEEVSFEKDENAVSSIPGTVPMSVNLTYKRGVKLDEKSAKFFFENKIPHSINRYYEVSKHVTFDKNKTVSYDTYLSKGAQRAQMSVLGIPRHPGQLYESFACILMFLVLAHIWYHYRTQIKTGFLFGVFMTMLWSERFFVEFFKENQEAWEGGLPLNMGQILSIPMFIVGVTLVVKYWGFTKNNTSLK